MVFRHLSPWLKARLSEAGPLVSLGALSFFVWSFITIADEVGEGATASLDRTLLLGLYHARPPRAEWLDVVMRDITALGGGAFLTLMTLSIMIYLILSRHAVFAAIVGLSVGGGALLSSLLKLFFERSRPDLVPHGVFVMTASFPSGHAMLSAATYLTLGLLLARFEPQRRIKVFFIALSIVLTVTIGFSRLYLGVHWPSDVLAGWCAGAAWACLCWFITLQLQTKLHFSPEGERAERSSG